MAKNKWWLIAGGLGLLVWLAFGAFAHPVGAPSPQPNITQTVWSFKQILLNGVPQVTRYAQASPPRLGPRFQITRTTAYADAFAYELLGYNGCNNFRGPVHYAPATGELDGPKRYSVTLLDCSGIVERQVVILNEQGTPIAYTALPSVTQAPRDEVVEGLSFMHALGQVQTYQLRDAELWLLSADEKMILVFAQTNEQLTEGLPPPRWP